MAGKRSRAGIAVSLALGVGLGVGIASQPWPIAEGGAIDLPGQNLSCGDVNGDNSVDIADSVFLLRYLFLGGIDPFCPSRPEPVVLTDLRNVIYAVEEFDVTLATGLSTMLAATEESLGREDMVTAGEVLASLEVTALLLPEHAFPSEIKLTLLAQTDRVMTMFDLPIPEGRATPKNDFECSVTTGRCDVPATGAVCFERKIRGKWNCASY